MTKTYGSKQALDGISMHIRNGVIIGLLGPNGCGKSTLFNIMAGIARPTAGRILFQGQSLSVRDKSRIAYLADQDYLYGWMTVQQVIEFYSSFYSDWKTERTGVLLRNFELKPSEIVSHLSKGMKARLKLLLVLARKAPLVLLDEPFSGIDPISKSKMISSILDEFVLGQQTILLSTHEMAEEESLFDEIIMMHQGKIVFHEETEDVRSRCGGALHKLWKEV
ncbi:ABC transporter ATP-binding protein [Paenibacillus tarimensis]